MPSIKTIEARLDVANVVQRASLCMPTSSASTSERCSQRIHRRLPFSTMTANAFSSAGARAPQFLSRILLYRFVGYFVQVFSLQG